MTENEPSLDPLQQYREGFEGAYKKVESRSRVVETIAALQGAIAFFEQGLKLGRENSEGVESLIEEIRAKLAKREQQLGEMLDPGRRKDS